MRVLFVNRFYWPETPATGQLLTDLAEGLAAAGHDVVVVTAAHREGVARDEVRAGLGQGACGNITCNGNLCTIFVQWDDTRGIAGSSTQRVTTSSRL